MRVAVPVGVVVGLLDSLTAEKAHHRARGLEGGADLWTAIALAFDRTTVRVGGARVGAVPPGHPIEALDLSGDLRMVDVCVAVVREFARGPCGAGAVPIVVTAGQRARTTDQQRGQDGRVRLS